jgi:dienelactone hydrolase
LRYIFLRLAFIAALAPLYLAHAQAASAAAAPPVFATLPLPPYVMPDTPQGSGPYPAVMEVDPSLPTHTVYRPGNLAALRTTRLPIVVFANGACVNVGNRFRYYLTEIASHGFLAIAIGPIASMDVERAASSSAMPTLPAPNSPAALKAGPGVAVVSSPTEPPATTARQLIDAIDWAVAENSRKASTYFGRLDTSKIAVMGQSCGGLQAIDAAHDPRVSTLGVWNSGTYSDDSRAWQVAAAHARRADVKTLRVPTIYVSGEPSDVAYPNAEADFALIDRVPVFRAWREQTGHTATYREPNGGAFGKVAVAWLQWQLKADPTAAKQFVGPQCGLCANPEWHVKKKNIE